MMLSNAFTCTGPYAILILCGIKRTENRSAWPEPSEGRAAISCSKTFCKEEYGQFIVWASANLPPEDFEKLPSWREVKDWPGKLVGVCDYKAREQTGREQWDEGYQYWWDLSNVVRLPEPISCRGNIGMWQMPLELAAKVSAADDFLRLRIETADDAYPLFRAAIPIAKDYEGFFVLPIDKERRPICKPILVSLGHIRGTTAVEFREVFREAFKVDADAIIVAHNHPSGDPTPSKADKQLTVALQSAAQLLGIKFLDHLVLGSADCEDGNGYVSVMENQV
ncbi:MAG: JAB domain-containing protein [Bacteroidales bacterium]|nr:JAB domain-containing protein [Bacteroidales bacterium]